MAFIDRVIGPDEKLIGIVSVHWIYGLKGLTWFALFAAGGAYLDFQLERLAASGSGQSIRSLEIFSNYIFLIGVAIGAFLLFFYVLMMLTTELGLTSKRIIYKKGFIFVDVKESDLEEIKAAEVDNGRLGRILNYGYINFDARFVENLTLPAINDPYRFLKAMNEMRSNLKQDSMSIVLEGPASGVQQANVKQPEPAPTNQKNDPNNRHIDDDRYEALESNPIKAAGNMFDDTNQEITNSKKAIKKDMAHMSKKERQKTADASQTSPDQTSESNDIKTSKPIIFKRDLAKRKENLARKMKSAFKRKAIDDEH